MGVEIEVRGLTKSFGRQVIWRDVSLRLPAGEISVMLGPSGTGKSVFLKTLVGLLKPEHGSIMIQGRDLVALKEHDLRLSRLPSWTRRSSGGRTRGPPRRDRPGSPVQAPRAPAASARATPSWLAGLALVVALALTAGRSC